MSEWSDKAEQVLREVFPGWLVTARGHSAWATWDSEDTDVSPRWTFDQMSEISEALGTRLIDVEGNDSRAMGSEWTGPYGSITVRIVVRRQL